MIFNFFFPSDRIFSFENRVLDDETKEFSCMLMSFSLPAFLKEKTEYLGNGCLVVKRSPEYY